MDNIIDDPQFFNLNNNENFNSYYLGEPFTIYDFSDTVETGNSYYFPVIQGNEVKLILTVVNTGTNYCATLGVDFSNEINYNAGKSEMLFYKVKGNLHIQTQTHDRLIYDMDKNNDEEIERTEHISYRNKLKLIDKEQLSRHNRKLNNVNKSIKNANRIAYAMYTPSFETNTTNIKKLNWDRCYIGQVYNGVAYGCCWASATAATYRYLTGNTSLNGLTICDLMNISYNQGGTVDDCRRALGALGITYSCTPDIISYTKLTSEIKNRKPIIAHGSTDGTPYGYSHSVNFIGYNSTNKADIVYYYDPASQQTSLSTPGYVGPKKTYPFTSGATTYYWINTAYA